ncbi:ankyrin [Rhizoclosmatium globosum]|uniref:Ankyrin n=1 Tax=Rhizoclosmatium globosum TaxID=329046 RepID=A0A1Y2CM21_9FUNG|nr:ankyrin [Rhizoclosmatium globosum]|eukprot:ORY48069.1 ankyrin [Rhizoclosmatium globosum]
MDALLNTGKVDPSFNNNNAIRVCCNHGHLSLLERLLQDPRTDPSVLNNSPVRLAAQNGYLEIVQFLAKDPRVTLSDSDSSALALACEHGQEEVVEFLLQEGSSDPTAFDNANLIDSVRFGNWNIVELLIEDGRVNIESHEYLVVTNAVDERRQDIINLILTRYSSTTHPILELLQSVIELDTSRLQEFLENDHYDHTLHIGGLAALLLAIEAGNIPIIKLLLSDSRVDPFTFDGECRALTYACHSGKMDVVKTLLEDKRIKPTQQVVYTTCLVLQFEVARELLRHECFVGRVTWDLDATDDELLVYVANMKQE